MKKRERGVLSIEAAIVLTLMLLLILFLFGFARVYRAQNLVSHATIQSADAVALESYLRETALQADASEVIYLANLITDTDTISVDSLESLRSANLPKIARQKFIAAIADSEAKADEKLKSMGVKDGIAGIDFSESKMDLGNDDVIIAINYTIEMQYPILGFDEINVTKVAKAKTFGEILFEVSTEPNVPGWGTTSGDDKVVYGSTVEIKATPKYGYKFVSWDDGNTENPRTVTVTDAQHYIAIFERDSFGVNISSRIDYNTTFKGIEHTNYGSFEGDGVYLYLDDAVLTAKPQDPNYLFKGWDLDGDGDIDKTNKTITVTVDKTFNDIKAVFKPALCKVNVSSNNEKFGKAKAVQGDKNGNSIEVEYGSRVSLHAVSADKTKFSFEKWSTNDLVDTLDVNITSLKADYEAIFEANTYTVEFYCGGTEPKHTTKVIRDCSIEGSNPYIESIMCSSEGIKGFSHWEYNNEKFTLTTVVNKNIKVYAVLKFKVTLDANGGKIDKADEKSYDVVGGTSFNFSSYIPYRNGFDFEGWTSDGCIYSGNVQINSNVIVDAKWKCKHKYDNGETMYVIISSNGGGCSNSEIEKKCSGCGDKYIEKGSGACVYEAWCGTTHNLKNPGKYYCTHNDAKHRWEKYGCITCKYCGRCKNGKVDSYGVYRSGDGCFWCVKHSGHLYYSGTLSRRPIKYRSPHLSPP